MKKSVFQKKNINASLYVNTITGETLQSEFGDVTSINKINSDLKIISSEEYVIIDSKALAYISTKFNQQDLGRILRMSDMVNGQYNVLYSTPKVPHNKETLMESLDYTVNKFRLFMKKLYKEGVISYLNSYINGKDCKFIILNPYFARKSKSFNVDCLNEFRTFLDNLNNS